MGLNISTGGGDGDFTPYVKYNAKAGRWYVKKDEGEVEVNNPAFVADFDNIKTGYFLYAAGVAPSIVYDPSLTVPVAKPSENHKRGFELNVFSQNAFGGVVTFGSTSSIVGGAVNDIFEQYERERANNPGALPVVQCNGVTPEVGKHGTNYKPNLAITKWVPRPAEFGGSAATAPQPQAQAAAAPVSNSVSEF